MAYMKIRLMSYNSQTGSGPHHLPLETLYMETLWTELKNFCVQTHPHPPSIWSRSIGLSSLIRSPWQTQALLWQTEQREGLRVRDSTWQEDTSVTLGWTQSICSAPSPWPRSLQKKPVLHTVIFHMVIFCCWGWGRRGKPPMVTVWGDIYLSSK